MRVTRIDKPTFAAVVKRQAAVCAAFALLLAIIVASLYTQDRHREWILRTEQAKHRLDVAFELISREIDAVRADALFLADQQPVRQFVQGDTKQFHALESAYASFVRRKETYDQLRLLDLNGRETLRVNYVGREAISVKPSELQDKSDRYYFRDALALRAGEVLVSDFDLNLEHGRLERPLKPVIRFVTPVIDHAGVTRGFLVLNYLGARLLSELDNATLPGFTILIRPDGHYLHSPVENDTWGWLLGHNRTFSSQFPAEWADLDNLQDCQLTSNGAFAARRIPLGRTSHDSPAAANNNTGRDSIIVISYLPRDEVFAASRELLTRLVLLAGSVFVALAIFAHFWAHATLTRRMQNDQIASSEERLRELSFRLLRIQEEERRSISREIHDELGQQATAINLDLKLADRNIDTPDAKPHLDRAIRENEQLLNNLHAFASRVRPAVLDDLGLHDAVESHLWEFQQRTSLTVRADLAFDSVEVPHDIADNAYRLLQESLNNVAKHANATEVDVAISIQRAGESNWFRMTIRDDGRGCGTAGHNGRRLGLVGMQERVDLLSGELRMESDVDQGTHIEIRLPFGDRSAERDRIEYEA